VQLGELTVSTARMYDKFESLLSEMGQNAPKDAGEREIFRRIFIRGYGDGWQDAEAVSKATHFLRLIGWQ
jgi:hypothetical protein